MIFPPRLRCFGCIILLAAAPAAFAKVEIDIKGVDNDIAENVRQFLTLSRYASRDDLTADSVARLQRRIPAETAQALQPFGYYQPEVKYKIVPQGDQGKDWKIEIDIQPGSPVQLSQVDIAVDGPGADNPRVQTVLDRHDLRPGTRLDHGTYEQVKGSLLRAATSSGYLDAHFTRNQLLIDTQSRSATVDLRLDTGECYHFGQIFVEQNVIRDGAMQRLLRMKQGAPYSNDALLATQYVLDDTQYFSSVEIASDDPDRETHQVGIHVKAKPGKRNRYGVSAGYATDTGARGKISWDNRLVNTSGHKTSLELIESQPLRSATARYIIPVRDIALEKVEFTLNSTHEELADTLSKRNEFATGLTQVMGRWQRVLFLKFSNETSVLPGETFTDFLIIPGISFATLPNYVMGREPLPYSLFFELTGSPHSLGSGASYLRLRIEAERVFNITQKWHLRLRSQLGLSYVADFSELPLSQRFFAGGDNSVRGFGLNELSPVDGHGNKIGGRDLVFGSVEVERDLPRNFGWAVFSDVGNAVNHFSDPLEYSVGVGLRYRIAVASLGVDVAQELSEPGHGPRLHLHLSTVF